MLLLCEGEISFFQKLQRCFSLGIIGGGMDFLGGRVQEVNEAN